MRLIFANSAWVHGPELVVRPGGGLRRLALQVRYGLVLHPDWGPVLIDTGYSEAVLKGPRSIGLRLYAWLLRPRLNAEQSIKKVLARFGYKPSDVRRIVLTHFHADHISALRAFPDAVVMGDLAALHAVRARSALGNLRHGVFTELLPDDLEARFVDIKTLSPIEAPYGLGHGHDLFGDGQLVAVPLPGHAEGHFGVCFPEFEPCLLYACDAQWHLDALATPERSAPLARAVPEGPQAAKASTQRLAAFRASGGQVLLCHDPREQWLDWSATDA